MNIKELDPQKMFAENNSLEKVADASSKIFEKKTVLGLDIYKYSQYPSIEQMYIPFLFDLHYYAAMDNCLKLEPFIFQHYPKDKEGFRKYFISAGDGGFQIFDTPIEATVFSIYFQLNVKRYNSGGDSGYRKGLNRLRELIGRIELRYAITLDDIYAYDNNFYGPAIINNARILSKDNLNRLLIDDNVLRWYDNKINSIENLKEITVNDFARINFFKTYDSSLTTTLFEKNHIKNVDIQKIGEIKVKDTMLDIHNMHIQAGLYSVRKNDESYNYYSMTLGNLNTKGIE